MTRVKAKAIEGMFPEGIGLAIFRMKKIEIDLHHDTILYGLIFKTLGMYLFPIIFVNFKTWFGASIPVD